MVWIRHTGKIQLMATVTIRWGVVVATAVTVNAIADGGMRAGQRKTRLAVVKAAGAPGGGRMTTYAVVRKIIRQMVWIGHTRKIQLMATVTIRWRIVVAIAMAINAIADGGMRAGQRKTRLAVVKAAGAPGRGAMASHAIVRKIIGHMVWIRHTGKIQLMAAEAIRWCIAKAVAVAINTIADRGMRAGQRKARLVVVKTARAPGILRMTIQAFVCKTGGLMIGIFDRIEIVLMAAKAVAGQTG